MRRGQLEFVGLIVVVLIIAIGFMFFVKLMFFGEKDEVGSSYQTIFAANALSSLVKYNIPSCEKNIGDLMVYFATVGGTTCKNRLGINDLVNQIKMIVPGILEKGKFNGYYFSIENIDNPDLANPYKTSTIINENNCKENPIGVYGPPYNLPAGFVLKLKICR